MLALGLCLLGFIDPKSLLLLLSFFFFKFYDSGQGCENYCCLNGLQSLPSHVCTRRRISASDLFSSVSF